MATRSRSARKSSSKSAQVTLNGRFAPGSRVTLVEVAGEHVLRAEGGKTIGTGVVDENGRVQFKSGVKAGARYFIVGRINGVHTEVRARGNVAADDNGGLVQAPVQPDPQTFGTGRVPVNTDAEAVTRLAQEQVPDGVHQRSSTATGTAHPVADDETVPYPDQEQEPYADGSVHQRSDTPVGQATPIADAPERQEDVPEDVHQRSCTPTGVATPLPPTDDPIEAQRGIESADAKAIAGDPGQAASRGVIPGETIASDGEPHVDNADRDQDPDELSGKALEDRAAELDIKGRGSMTADQLRAAIRDAQK